ncbi:MAG TPA: hypothetical protein PKD64_19195 [Pirellulaceae bacterium]|nr:hypothetical protein [Pirellulaceae bacterium]HMO94317.1 hypothetical protein [Pirellulaceae bacterium]HMP71325.1 hypothetical protein [Pirellulaceae bacterium]
MIHPEDQTRCCPSVCPARDLSRLLLKAIRKMALGVFFFGLVFQVGVAAGQATRTWNGDSGWFDVGSNWSGGIAPGSSDTALFTSGTSTARWDEFTGNRNIHRLWATGGNTTFQSFRPDQYELTINRNGWDALDISGAGTVVTVRGLHFNITNGGAIIRSGATLHVDGIHPGGTRLSTAFDLEHRGTMSLTSGAIVTAQGSTYVGFSSLDPQAYLAVSTGSQLNSNLTSHIGLFAGSSGVVQVIGTGSAWNNSDSLFVGHHGSGNLYVELGGVVTSTDGFLGFHAGSTGTAIIADTGSRWSVGNNLHVGWENTTASGVLYVQGGGRVHVGNSTSGSSTGLYIGHTTNSTTAGNVRVGANSTVTNAGRVIVGQSNGTFGSATVSGTNAVWNNAGHASIGEAGTGTLTISNGGVFSNVNGFVGAYLTGNGTATVSGAGSQWNNSGSLVVGNSGTGTLHVQSAGVVTSNNGFVGLNGGSTGTATITDINSRWLVANNLHVGWGSSSATGVLNVNNGARLHVGDSAGILTPGIHIGHSSDTTSSGNVRVGSNSTINNDGWVYVGLANNVFGWVTVSGDNAVWNNSNAAVFGDGGTGRLTVSHGGTFGNSLGVLGLNSGSTGIATVDGAGSQWNNSGGLIVGNEGAGTLNVVDNGLVSVGGTTTIGNQGTINLLGGRLEFGAMSLDDFSAINKYGGSLAGALNHSGYTNVSGLPGLNAVTTVDMTDVNLSNSGTIFGNGTLGVSIVNTANGELEASAGERLRFAGNLTNAGELNAFGGQLRFDGSGVNSNEINNFNGVFRVGQEMVNQSSGFIGGRGQFIANGGWENHGTMVFSSGTSDVLGHVENFSGSMIVTTGGGTTTFHNNVLHNGAEIRTAANSSTVILGDWSGAGAFTGTGTVYLEGGVHPGNSPDFVSFGGNLVLGLSSATFIELGGLLDGQYDAFQIAGDLSINGSLNVSLIDGFELGFNQVFSVMQAGGATTGMFAGLGEGALVGNFGGMDLFITYNPDGGNGMSLFTAIPEPSSAMLVGLTLFGLSFRVRRRSVAAT